MKKSKAFLFQQDLLNRAKSRTAKSAVQYEEAIKASVRFFCLHGFFNKDLVDKEMYAYIHFVDMVMKERLQEERYLRVKGVELCPEESR